MRKSGPLAMVVRSLCKYVMHQSYGFEKFTQHLLGTRDKVSVPAQP